MVKIVKKKIFEKKPCQKSKVVKKKFCFDDSCIKDFFWADFLKELTLPFFEKNHKSQL